MRIMVSSIDQELLRELRCFVAWLSISAAAAAAAIVVNSLWIHGRDAILPHCAALPGVAQNDLRIRLAEGWHWKNCRVSSLGGETRRIVRCMVSHAPSRLTVHSVALVLRAVYPLIHKSHGSIDATLQSTIDTQEHFTPLYCHLRVQLLYFIRAPAWPSPPGTVGWSSALWLVSHYLTTLSLLPPDSPSPGDLSTDITDSWDASWDLRSYDF